MDLFIPKFIQYQLYLLQLENYELGRYWKLLLKQGPFPGKKYPQTKELVWAKRDKGLMLMAVSLHFLAIILAGLIVISTHRGVDGLFSFLIIIGLICLPFYFLWFSIALLFAKVLDGFIKQRLYFFIAGYFKFFARIQLAQWKPRIVVVTGSSGKTTLLHLIESQLGQKAKYSHNANSSFGIPFDILGFQRNSFKKTEWIHLFLAAPFKAFKKIHKEKLYIAEADCDRPGEGKFLADLLKPEAVLITGISGTHSVNFDRLIVQKKFANVERAIAFEFGYFLEHTGKLAIINGDDKLIAGELDRVSAKGQSIKYGRLTNYQIFENGTEFNIGGTIYRFNCLLPKEVFYSIAQTVELLKYLNEPIDSTFKNFILPPGRGSVFKGIKGIVIIDSSYNATPDGMSATLEMFNLYPAPVKWLVLGDMLEQGKQERDSHEELAKLIAKMKWDKIVLMGPRVSKYTYPKLEGLVGLGSIVKFQFPKSALAYLQEHIKGDETILFKGARFMEGIVEHLLADKNDISKLCRREAVWQKRRKDWGL